MLKPPTDKITAETREKLLALAEFIETDQRHGFWMNYEFTKTDAKEMRENGVPSTNYRDDFCGTAGCIAGHVLFMHGRYTRDDVVISEEASRLLGLYRADAGQLFYPGSDALSEIGQEYDTVSRSQAVRVLRHFAYTGDVDWSV